LFEEAAFNGVDLADGESAVAVAEEDGGGGTAEGEVDVSAVAGGSGECE
jgi:hypothetical protein